MSKKPSFWDSVKMGAGLGIGSAIGSVLVEIFGPFWVLVAIVLIAAAPCLLPLLVLLIALLILPFVQVYAVVFDDYSMVPKDPQGATVFWIIGGGIGLMYLLFGCRLCIQAISQKFRTQPMSTETARKPNVGEMPVAISQSKLGATCTGSKNALLLGTAVLIVLTGFFYYIHTYPIDSGVPKEISRAENSSSVLAIGESSTRTENSSSADVITKELKTQQGLAVPDIGDAISKSQGDQTNGGAQLSEKDFQIQLAVDPDLAATITVAVVPSVEILSSSFPKYDQAMVNQLLQNVLRLMDSRDPDLGNQNTAARLQFILNEKGTVRALELWDSDSNNAFGRICERAILEGVPYQEWPAQMRRRIKDGQRSVSVKFVSERALSAAATIPKASVHTQEALKIGAVKSLAEDIVASDVINGYPGNLARNLHDRFIGVEVKFRGRVERVDFRRRTIVFVEDAYLDRGVYFTVEARMTDDIHLAEFAPGAGKGRGQAFVIGTISDVATKISGRGFNAKEENRIILENTRLVVKDGQSSP